MLAFAKEFGSNAKGGCQYHGKDRKRHGAIEMGDARVSAINRQAAWISPLSSRARNAAIWLNVLAATMSATTATISEKKSNIEPLGNRPDVWAASNSLGQNYSTRLSASAANPKTRRRSLLQNLAPKSKQCGGPSSGLC